MGIERECVNRLLRLIERHPFEKAAYSENHLGYPRMLSLVKANFDDNNIGILCRKFPRYQFPGFCAPCKVLWICTGDDDRFYESKYYATIEEFNQLVTANYPTLWKDSSPDVKPEEWDIFHFSDDGKRINVKLNQEGFDHLLEKIAKAHAKGYAAELDKKYIENQLSLYWHTFSPDKHFLDAAFRVASYLGILTAEQLALGGTIEAALILLGWFVQHNLLPPDDKILVRYQQELKSRSNNSTIKTQPFKNYVSLDELAETGLEPYLTCSGPYHLQSFLNALVWDFDGYPMLLENSVEDSMDDFEEEWPDVNWQCAISKTFALGISEYIIHRLQDMNTSIEASVNAD